MSFIIVDDHDKRPPYEQIASAIVDMIADGSLEPGSHLAPIRQLAGDLGIAPNTVARAYRELEQAGRVVSRGRRGTIIAETSAASAKATVIAQLRAAIDDARRAGLSSAEVIAVASHHASPS